RAAAVSVPDAGRDTRRHVERSHRVPLRARRRPHRLRQRGVSVPRAPGWRPRAAATARGGRAVVSARRRVVTGHDASGKSVLVSDEQLEPGTVDLFPGWAFLPVWGADETPTYPDDGREPEWHSYFP